MRFILLLSGTCMRTLAADMTKDLQRLVDPDWAQTQCSQQWLTLRTKSGDEQANLDYYKCTGGGVFGAYLKNKYLKAQTEAVEECKRKAS